MTGVYFHHFTTFHYSDVIMSAMSSLITGIRIVYSIVCLGADPRKHQSSASLAFVKGIHRWPVNSPHKGTVTRKMFPCFHLMTSSCHWYIFRTKLPNSLSDKKVFFNDRDGKYATFTNYLLWHYYMIVSPSWWDISELSYLPRYSADKMLYIWTPASMGADNCDTKRN